MPSSQVRVRRPLAKTSDEGPGAPACRRARSRSSLCEHFSRARGALRTRTRTPAMDCWLSPRLIRKLEPAGPSRQAHDTKRPRDAPAMETGLDVVLDLPACLPACHWLPISTYYIVHGKQATDRSLPAGMKLHTTARRRRAWSHCQVAPGGMGGAVVDDHVRRGCFSSWDAVIISIVLPRATVLGRQVSGCFIMCIAERACDGPSCYLVLGGRCLCAC